MNKNSIAITGASGFIGAHLAKRYLEIGYKVVAIDNLLRGDSNRLPIGHKNLTIFNSDIRYESEKLANLLLTSETVYHLAAVNGTENFYKQPQLVLDVGIRGIMNVMDACKLAGVKNIIVASSAEVYQSPNIFPTPEDVPLTLPNSVNPRYSYGGSKILTELVAMNYHRETFERVIIFRPHNVYGPDMGSKHVVPQLILKTLDLKKNQNNTALKISGAADSSRAFAFVEDVIDGLLILGQKGKHREIYHVGNDVECTVRDLANNILSIIGINASIEAAGMHDGETLRRCPSIEKIKLLGYKPKFNLLDGLKKTIDWYKSEYTQNKNQLV